jgi:molecular chaperone GrpE
MSDFENDERLLERFRGWLQATRQEAADLGEPVAASTPCKRVGLERLVEEFTALRHELKLQTRGSRALEERLEASMLTLAEAAGLLRAAAASEASSRTEAADRAFASALADLDEALERAREQWKKNLARLSGDASAIISELDAAYAGQSWWQRRSTAAYHSQVRERIQAAEARSRSDRQALLTALLSGYDLIQQRLARTMASAGVTRIPAVGRPVDPERMVVVEAVDAAGEPGHVIDEIRRGYTWKGGLLRPAEVRAIRPRYDQDET